MEASFSFLQVKTHIYNALLLLSVDIKPEICPDMFRTPDIFSPEYIKQQVPWRQNDSSYMVCSIKVKVWVRMDAYSHFDLKKRNVWDLQK